MSDPIAVEALAPIRELHRPVHRVYPWSAAERMVEPCPDCWGRAGVHPCGCWTDEDIVFSCACGAAVWTECPTAQLCYTADEIKRRLTNE